MCLGDLQKTKHNTFLLEPHLAEKNQKEETKLQNPEPPECTKLLYATLPEKTGGLPHHQTPAPNLLGRCRQTGLDARRNTRTTKIEILLFLNLEFFFFSLSVCLSCSMFVYTPSLPVYFFGSPFSFYFLPFFLGFVSFTIIS
jgi:hypothetical protein